MKHSKDGQRWNHFEYGVTFLLNDLSQRRISDCRIDLVPTERTKTETHSAPNSRYIGDTSSLHTSIERPPRCVPCFAIFVDQIVLL